MENNTVNQPITPNMVAPIEPKKKHNVPAILLGFLMLVFAGAAVFFGIKYFEPKENKVENNTEANVPKNDDNGGETIKAEGIAEQYRDVYDTLRSLTSGVETQRDYIRTSGTGLTYKPEGLNTYVPMRFDLYKQIKNSNSNDKNGEILKSRLTDAGFEYVGVLPHLGSAGPDILGYLNSDKKIVCGLHGDSYDATYGTGDFVVLECAKTDWQWLTSAEKTLVSELETAYHEKTGEYPVTLYNLDNKVKDSKTAPYQTLDVELGGGRGLFYRTSQEGKWQYFTVTQSPLNCSDYNTEDLKKAYTGEVCYNGSQESIVQL